MLLEAAFVHVFCSLQYSRQRSTISGLPEVITA